MSGSLPALDHCPRCGGGFECGAQSATPCPCTTLTLSAALQARLRQRYTGCLCLACLQVLAADAVVNAVADAVADEAAAGPAHQSLRTTTLPTE